MKFNNRIILLTTDFL